MGEWGGSTKEYRLVEFQQRIGTMIPNEEDEEYDKPFSENKNTLRWRRRKEGKQKSKQDYEDILTKLREEAKNK